LRSLEKAQSSIDTEVSMEREMLLDLIKKPPLLEIKVSKSEIILLTGYKKITIKPDSDIGNIKIYSQDDFDGYFQFNNKKEIIKNELLYTIQDAFEKATKQNQSFFSDIEYWEGELENIKKKIMVSKILIYGFFNKTLINRKSDIIDKIYRFREVKDMYNYYIEFSLHPDIAILYKDLQENFRKVKECHSIWEVTDTSRINSHKKRTIAKEHTTAWEVSFKEDTYFYDDFFSKAKGMSMIDNDNNYYTLYPAFFILYMNKKYKIISYNDIELSCSNTNTLDDGDKPNDAKIIDHTYKYVNNNGTRDNRRVNNYRIPIMEYYKIDINIKNETNVTFMFSNSDSGEKFAEAFSKYIAIFK
jgi:hypothetical protein